MSKKIAPMLDHLVRALEAEKFHPLDTKARAELRALLAVARAAGRVIILGPLDPGEEEHYYLSEKGDDGIALARALRRLARVSSRPSTVEGNRKPASNSSRPGRGRAR